MIVTDADRDTSVVVDASALAALVFGEPDAEAVAARLAGRQLIAPTMLRYEMASVYLKKLRRYAAERSALSEMLRAYSQLGIQEVQPDTEGIARIAERTGLTAYDAAYLWLGQLIRAPVVTLDQRLAEVARGLGLPEG
ncbi:MAG: PIN domain-containing protein [Gemmatimonadales bacterium]|nr:MAG: PIN domain-containing protein [Gemmatimonadales bacterium]